MRYTTNKRIQSFSNFYIENKKQLYLCLFIFVKFSKLFKTQLCYIKKPKIIFRTLYRRHARNNFFYIQLTFFNSFFPSTIPSKKRNSKSTKNNTKQCIKNISGKTLIIGSVVGLNSQSLLLNKTP